MKKRKLLFGLFMVLALSMTTTLASANSPSKGPIKSQLEERQEDFSSEKEMGFIQSITQNGLGGKIYLSIDFAQWLTPEESKKLSIEKGICTEETEFCPQIFINNEKIETKTFEVSKIADFSIMSGQGILGEIDFLIFKQLINGPDDHWRKSPFWVKFNEEGVIVSIEEQFLP